jgi:hypothetical protein
MTYSAFRLFKIDLLWQSPFHIVSLYWPCPLLFSRVLLNVVITGCASCFKHFPANSREINIIVKNFTYIFIESFLYQFCSIIPSTIKTLPGITLFLSLKYDSLHFN